MVQRVLRWVGLEGRLFNYANNPLTIGGVIVATVSAILIFVFILAHLSMGFHNPYIGVFAYVILPMIMALGLIVIPVGMWRRRRRLLAEGATLEEMSVFPKLDFNDPRIRRVATAVIVLTCVNGILFGTASYFATETMDTVEFCGLTCHTVMRPEYTAYQNSPHSRVKCVECHIGPGASWFVRSKIDGLRQVWHTVWGTYNRPIETPIHNLRPSRDTCEQCHWPAKHHGDKLKVFARFAEDEANTPSYTAMIMKTGGGSLDLGAHGGIHWWHIYSDNRIRYVALDDRRQEIGWVELTTADGEVRIYTRPGQELPPPEELERRARIMDCIDCHNRPTHYFPSPDRALDALLEQRPEFVALPYFKREAKRAITAGYPTHDEGVAAVRQAVLTYYRENHPEVWETRRETVERAAEAAASVYDRTVFPEMETDWETHPNNIGHEEFPGCWRCHDDEMQTADGQHTIPQDCDTCHEFVVEDTERPPVLADLIQPAE